MAFGIAIWWVTAQAPVWFLVTERQLAVGGLKTLTLQARFDFSIPVFRGRFSKDPTASPSL